MKGPRIDQHLVYVRCPVLLPLAVLLGACCPPFCIPDSSCNAIPSSDAEAPTATITIEYWDSNGQPVLETIDGDARINVDAAQRFNIVYSAKDNVGIKELWLNMRWTQWVGGVPQSVTPMISPTTFGDSACTPRSGSSKFTYEGPKVYRFSANASDYHDNRGSSPTLTVVHGQPPTT